MEAKDEGGRMKDEPERRHAFIHPSAFILHPLTDLAPRRRRLGGCDEDHLISVGVGGRQQHALADLAAHGAGGEVGDDDDLLADELLRGIVLAQAGADLPFLRAQVDLENQELVGVGMGLAIDHRRDPQLELGEVVVLDHVGIGSRGIHWFSFVG